MKEQRGMPICVEVYGLRECFILFLNISHAFYIGVAGWHPPTRVQFEMVSVAQKEC